MHALDAALPRRAQLKSTLPDFAALFEALPSPHMVLDRNFDFVAVNAAYCKVTERSPEELLGRNLFDMFPNPGEPGRRLRQSLQTALDTGQPDTLAYIEYPIPLPLSRGGGFELRYWTAVHTPLRGADGEVQFVVQNTVDVTELQRLQQMAFGGSGQVRPGETELFQRARDVERANQALSRETQGLRELFMQAPGFMAVLAGEEHRFALVNTAYQQLIGHRQVVGKPIGEALPEVREQGFVELLTTVLRSREPFIGQAVSVLLQRTSGAPLEERFVDFIYQPILGADGEAWGVFVEGSDVTDRVLAERQQRLLLDELNHRVKNTLATVQAIAAQTLRTNSEPAAFREAFESRLVALSSTHDLLTAANWTGAALRDVVQMEFKPFGPERYEVSGPDVSLSPAEALTLGLLFHELATNAAKYGALSTADGSVEVSWRVEEAAERRLLLEWVERGGPKVTPPTRRGFGSRLIERSLQGEMRGEAALDFAEDGLRCRIRLPLKG